MKWGAVMVAKKAILMVVVFWIILTMPVFSFSEPMDSGVAKNAIGKVEITVDKDQSATVEFEACEKTDTKPAKGYLHSWQANKSEEIYAEVKYVVVDGDYAWFAGKCTEGKLAGRWYFIVVHDGGTPGRLVDHFWWDWLADTADAEDLARQKVENTEKPANNKFINNGDIEVNFSSRAN